MIFFSFLLFHMIPYNCLLCAVVITDFELTSTRKAKHDFYEINSTAGGGGGWRYGLTKRLENSFLTDTRVSRSDNLRSSW